MDGLKGKVSCDVGCRSANTDAPATSQHARKRLFNESFSCCQARNADVASFLQGAVIAPQPRALHPDNSTHFGKPLSVIALTEQ
jgi:hypothetical protein